MKPHVKTVYSRVKVNGPRKPCHSNSSKCEAGIIILISDRADLRWRNVIKDKERNYIIIKQLTLQEDIRF
jgi:hypothetical protein